MPTSIVLNKVCKKGQLILMRAWFVERADPCPLSRRRIRLRVPRRTLGPRRQSKGVHDKTAAFLIIDQVVVDTEEEIQFILLNRL